MSERPILFSGEMVRAILDGRKTQTRRVVKLRENYREMSGFWKNAAGKCVDADGPCWSFGNQTVSGDPSNFYVDERVRCPYGQPGDRLWVRENIRFAAGFLDEASVHYADQGCLAVSSNSGRVPPAKLAGYFRMLDKSKAKRAPLSIPSIHMPRWASRIALEITGVRVERLQEISAADAIAEGVDNSLVGQAAMCPSFAADPLKWPRNTWVGGYRFLWESINGPGSWDANPWVWVLNFRRVQP